MTIKYIPCSRCIGGTMVLDDSDMICINCGYSISLSSGIDPEIKYRREQEMKKIMRADEVLKIQRRILRR